MEEHILSDIPPLGRSPLPNLTTQGMLSGLEVNCGLSAAFLAAPIGGVGAEMAEFLAESGLRISNHKTGITRAARECW